MNSRAALVTGASRGIGRAIAARLARDGFCVAIHYHRTEEDARHLRDVLSRETGMEHLLVRADAADPQEVKHMVSEAIAALGRLDVLVNNAGIYELTPFTLESFEEWQRLWRRTLDVNLMSAVHATFCALPAMRAQGKGKVINVASRSAFRAETEAPAYAVSKAGMVNLTRCLARAEAANGILAYCIAPGWVETAMAREGMETMRDEILGQIPLGRIASVDDVAGVASFLASSDADYLTGVTIDVNGGSYLH